MKIVYNLRYEDESEWTLNIVRRHTFSEIILFIYFLLKKNIWNEKEFTIMIGDLYPHTTKSTIINSTTTIHIIVTKYNEENI